MKRLDRRFADSLSASGWLAARAGVVVGVSGGVDSMTLLHLMCFRDGLPGVRLHAAHVDHRMRAASGEDAVWVRGICAEWGVPFHLCEAAETVATEAEGRELRYRFFEEVRQGLGEGAVAMTAHTADDQAETVLFRAARGSGPRGLAGIRAARPPSVVRPLLPFRRAEIETYAAERGIPFRDDPTNRDPRWTRNRLRHYFLPALEEAVPGASAALAALAGTSRMEAAALDELLDERIGALAAKEDAAGPAPAEPAHPSGALSLDVDALCALSRPVLTLVLRRAVHRLGGDPGRTATEALVRFVREAPSGRRIAIAGGVVVERHLGLVKFRGERGGKGELPRGGGAGRGSDGAGTGPGTPRRPQAGRVRVDATRGEGVAVGGGWVAEVAWGPRRRRGFAYVAYFSEHDVRFPLKVRSWKAGDRMAMPYGRKKVKKLLLEARVAADVREGLPVVAEASGSVVWIPGVVDPFGTDAGTGDPAGPARVTPAPPGCWVSIRLDHRPPGR